MFRYENTLILGSIARSSKNSFRVKMSADCFKRISYSRLDSLIAIVYRNVGGEINEKIHQQTFARLPMIHRQINVRVDAVAQTAPRLVIRLSCGGMIRGDSLKTPPTTLGLIFVISTILSILR